MRKRNEYRKNAAQFNAEGLLKRLQTAASVGKQPASTNPLKIRISANINNKTAPDTIDLCSSIRFLRDYGMRVKTLRRAQALAQENGTTAAAELIAFHAISETVYYEMLARHLNVRFVGAHEIKDIAISGKHLAHAINKQSLIWARVDDGMLKAIIAPDPRQIERLEKMAGNCKRADRMVITTPTALREALKRSFDQTLVQDATHKLALENAQWSAWHGASAWQGAAFSFLATLSVASFLIKPNIASLSLHIFLSVFFMLCVVIRVAATLGFRELKIKPIEHLSNAEKPIYSVMVALYDEADVVPDLIANLKRLQWPRSKLEIKLVCEFDDKATLSALQGQDLDSRFEIIHVPFGEPRTKPKALCYALAFTKGSLITVYDAEDNPHPEQLLEAYAAFKNGANELACVQAPLHTTNARKSLWSTMFHFEYAGLFGGLLPWLARRQSPILLGGTSNHFRRSALVEVGAWDPFNVTEDADLGLRLWRRGYQTSMISRPTYEDAPTDFRTWLPQRTRWLKGWMQTWIVHMRRPSELWSNMSFGAFFITQALLTGTIASALLHPILIANALMLTFTSYANPNSDILRVLFILDWTIISVSYISFMALCWQASEISTRRTIGHRILLTPIYWGAISIAAWRAFKQLMVNPFYWEKTPHKPHEKDQ